MTVEHEVRRTNDTVVYGHAVLILAMHVILIIDDVAQPNQLVAGQSCRRMNLRLSSIAFACDADSTVDRDENSNAQSDASRIPSRTRDIKTRRSWQAPPNAPAPPPATARRSPSYAG